MATVGNKAIPGGGPIDRRLGSRSIFSQDSFEISPSDTIDLSIRPRELFIGTGGTLRIITSDNNTVNFTVPTGSYLKQMPKRVMSTGTTATGIVGIV